MKLITYRINGKEDWGIVEDNIVFSSKDMFGESCPTSLLEYILSTDKPYIAHTTNNSVGIPLENVEILPPIPTPRKNVFCIGKNYLDHIKESDDWDKQIDNIMKYPVFFTKSSNTIIGAYDDIPLHKGITEQLDYEVELAVIIGKKGKDLKEEEVMDHIFGYTILNDISARDLQKNHAQFFKGKSLDGSCPIGPWIVSKDEIENPNNLNLCSKVNGEIRQNSNTSKMIYQIPKLISILSKGLTLEPGDIIATGTPEGVGKGFNPPKYLKEGDVVRVEVENIGYMENKVVDK